jgi:D-arabinose 1-dehydrogenase-like Zn-dependent alcohol dehydrogenase
VLVGVPSGFSSLDFELFRLISDELNLTGCRCATRQEIRESLELVRRGVVKAVVMNTFPLGELNKVQKLIDKMELQGRTAIVFD